MPPVMGAGAFIMADLLGMPYLGIAAAAVLPAVMYYLGVFVAIDCAARRYHYKGLAEEDRFPSEKCSTIKNPLPVISADPTFDRLFYQRLYRCYLR